MSRKRTNPALDDELDAVITDAAEMLLTIRHRDIRKDEDRALFRRQLLPMFKREDEWLVEMIIIRAQTIEIERRMKRPKSGP